MSERLSAALADRYRIERELGQGGMATVCLAHDLQHERKVALKVLKEELGAVLGVERFLAEIRVTANLPHPNLLPLFDSGEADGLLSYVMPPYIAGETLRTRLDNEQEAQIFLDRQLIAFTSNETGGDEAWTRDFPVPRGKWNISRGNGRAARWSPDGTFVYFWRGATVE